MTNDLLPPHHPLDSLVNHRLQALVQVTAMPSHDHRPRHRRRPPAAVQNPRLIGQIVRHAPVRRPADVRVLRIADESDGQTEGYLFFGSITLWSNVTRAGLGGKPKTTSPPETPRSACDATAGATRAPQHPLVCHLHSVGRRRCPDGPTR